MVQGQLDPAGHVAPVVRVVSCRVRACHTSHVARRTSHVTPHTSHLTPHTSHLTRHLISVLLKCAAGMPLSLQAARSSIVDKASTCATCHFRMQVTRHTSLVLVRPTSSVHARHTPCVAPHAISLFTVSLAIITSSCLIFSRRLRSCRENLKHESGREVE